MIFQATSECLQGRFPPEHVEYLRNLAQLALALATLVAVSLYLSRGGNLVRLAPS